jgi:hypothetical protein
LRADMTILPNHDTQRVSEEFHGISENCRCDNWS